MKENIKKITISGIIAILFSIVLNVILVKNNTYTDKFFLDRIFVTFCLSCFAILHFTLGSKKIYSFIIKNRYILAFIFLIVTTLLSYNGSSMGVLSNFIFEEDKNNTLLFNFREENNHEYGKETLYSIAQKSNINNYINSNLRGTQTDMFTYTNAPVKDILIIGKIFNIGYLFLNSEMALSFWWNFRLMALLLATFEFCRILTKKNDFYSGIGSFVITFSAMIQWKFSTCLIDVIIFGEIILILLDMFLKLKEDKKLVKLLISVGIGISFTSYLFTFDIENIIAFGYMFIALAIWIIIKNKENYKFKIIDLVYLFIPVLITVALNYRYYLISDGKTIFTVATEIERNKGGFSLLMSYIYGVFLPYKNISGAIYFSSIISVFPIPVIIMFYYLYKNEKHSEFFMPMAVFVTLEIIHCISGFPGILSTITLFKYVSIESAVMVIGIMNVLIYLYILSNVQEKIFNIKYSIRIALVTICIVAFISVPNEIYSNGYLCIFGCIYCLLAFLLLNSGEKKYRTVFAFFIILFTLISGVFVNPITKGVSVITDTKLANKIQALSEKGDNWISIGENRILSNYAIANNVKVLNSTQIIPNEELFIKVLGKDLAKEKENIWNRYSNLEIKISDKNDVNKKENSGNTIILEITKEKIKDLNIKYILTYEEILDSNFKKEYENMSENYIESNGVKYNKIAIYEVL